MNAVERVCGGMLLAAAVWLVLGGSRNPLRFHFPLIFSSGCWRVMNSRPSFNLTARFLNRISGMRQGFGRKANPTCKEPP
ncbi:hypothetical protein SRHO_G00303810 [Serrasalmus rhombeus]